MILIRSLIIVTALILISKKKLKKGEISWRWVRAVENQSACESESESDTHTIGITTTLINL